MASSAERWKNQERQVALDMGGKRIPNNGFGQPDVDHPMLAIQVKTVKSLPVWFRVKWDQTKRDAVKIGKVPFLAICHAPGAGIKVERVACIPIETAREWYDAWAELQTVYYCGTEEERAVDANDG